MASLIVHAMWAMFCERLAPRRDVAGRSSAVSAPRARASRATTSGRPAAFVSTPVLAVVDETPDIRTFRFDRPAGFSFVAGQFVPVRITIDGKPHVRCYSISSSPDARGFIEISVRRQGVVSGALHASLEPGRLVSIGRPAGRFVYPETDARPLALIAGGIGITPLLAMFRHGVAADPLRPITLFYSARRKEDLAFLPELRLLAERHPQARLAVTLTQETGTSDWRRGRIDAALIDAYVPQPADTLFAVCGPAPMIAEMKSVLRGMGVPEDQIRSEEFETGVAATLLNATLPAAGTASLRLPGRPERAGEVSAAPAHVTFTLSNRTVDATRSMTLLELAESAGVEIPSSCRSGVCQSCRTRVCAGAVDCQSDVIDQSDLDEGFVLPCVSWPLGDCALEA